MVRIFICGDIINRFNNDQFIGQELQAIIKSADYSIGNFEGTLPFNGIASNEMVQDYSTLNSLRKAGFSMMLLSNNHIGDYGYVGFSNTVNAIKQIGFDSVGAGFSFDEAYKPLIKKINGIKIGFINVCEAIGCLFKTRTQHYGCAWTGAKILENIIPSVKKEVDFLIMLPHSGLELNQLPLSHTRELYRHYCDLGADVIVASHPHVPQGIETYKGKYIFYSLGNFYFPESEKCDDTLMTNQSYSLLLDIEGSNIDYEVVYHKTKDLIVEVDTRPSFSLDKLSNMLSDSEYGKKVVERDRSVFNQSVYNLYRDAIFGIARGSSMKDKFRLVLRLMKPIGDNELNKYLKSFHKITQSETYINLIDSAIGQKDE